MFQLQNLYSDALHSITVIVYSEILAHSFILLQPLYTISSLLIQHIAPFDEMIRLT
jgi:hypothetical protein